MRIEVGEAPVPLAVLRKAWLDEVTVVLSGGARRRIAAAADTIETAIEGGRPIYGVNTGCGHLAHVRIGDEQLAELQENIVRSHAAGVGEDLGDGIVRLVILTKLMALARGHSGVRMAIVEALGALLEHGIYPRIPSKGSAGASGDLAPLAHLAGVLIGEGEARIGKEAMSGAEALRQAGVEPMRLAPKEGLALLNGTQVSTALALAARLSDRERPGRRPLSPVRCPPTRSRAATSPSTAVSRKCGATVDRLPSPPCCAR